MKPSVFGQSPISYPGGRVGQLLKVPQSICADERRSSDGKQALRWESEPVSLKALRLIVPWPSSGMVRYWRASYA